MEESTSLVGLGGEFGGGGIVHGTFSGCTTLNQVAMDGMLAQGAIG